MASAFRSGIISNVSIPRTLHRNAEAVRYLAPMPSFDIPSITQSTTYTIYAMEI